MIQTSLHWIDSTIVIVSILLAVIVGVYFSKKQKSTSAYFAASGKIPAWAVGMSMFATIISSVTFLAYPGAAYGGNWILLVQGLMVPIVLVGLIGFIVPLYRKVIKLSTYEYFERRFGTFARFYSSVAFILENFSKMGAVLYLMGLAMAMFTGGVDITTIIIAVGVVIIILTYLGGMEAIIWMDVVQGFLLIAGGLITIIMLFILTDGGPAAIFSIAAEYDKIDFGPYTMDLVHTTFLVMVLNGIFYAVQKYGTDQSIVQRYLTAKDDKSAKKASYLGVFMSVPAWALFMFVGTCLFAYYHINTGILPEGIKDDEVFPFFIATEMPVGIVGLIIAALAAGAISSIDSSINCISACVVEDYYSRIRPNASDKSKLWVGKISVLVVGVGSILVALLYVSWGGEGVLGSLFGLYAIISAGIVGIFLLGLFSRRANWQGLYIGIAAAVLFTAYAVLTSKPFDMGGGEKKLLIDLGEWNFKHSTYMLGVYSHLIVLIIGYAASFLFKTPLCDKSLTIYGYLEEKRMQKN
ncbi:MAG: sodium:solute symporter [Prevotellaceae bacterium]|nr:sodium:solute symporter [Prevotellaceae bacterium]